VLEVDKNATEYHIVSYKSGRIISESEKICFNCCCRYLQSFGVCMQTTERWYQTYVRGWAVACWFTFLSFQTLLNSGTRS